MEVTKSSTIYDVATAAGVSVKTVSRVLNGENSVRLKNREKVQCAVRALDYKPDFNARRLRTKQSYLIGLLYIDYWSNSYSSRLTSGAIAACDEAGYDLLVRPVSDKNKITVAEHISYMTERSNPDGYIIAPPLCDRKDLLDAIRKMGKPAVRILPWELDERDCVYCDIVQGVKDAIKHLIFLGHTRIGIVNITTVHGGLWRYQGYREAIEEAGLPLAEELMYQSGSDETQCELAIRKMLNLPDRPTAIFTFNDFFATIVYKVANQMQIKIPYDLSVIGFDDDPISQNLWPPLTTVQQPVLDLGKAAANKLIKSLIQGKTNLVPPSLNCTFVQRSSCGPRY